MIGYLRRLLAPGRAVPDAEAKRWVVVDTETTGLDAARDALLAIGGVALDDEGIRADDSFEAVLRHTGPTDPANVVVHGLGREQLLAGERTEDALRAFHAWVAGAPCAAFHADFDRRVLERAARNVGLPPLSGRWLDLAPLAAALAPEVPRQGTGTLDDWLVAFGLACPGRHNAASDALAAAELLLRLRSIAAAQGTRSFDQLARLGAHRRWLGGLR